MMKKLIALFFISAASPAMAHLTWIDAGVQSMGLSTGHNFPAKEITVKGEYVEFIRCIDTKGSVSELGFEDNSIRYLYADKPANCLARLKTSLIELTPRQGAQHFEESKVSKALIDKVRSSKKFEEEYFKLAQITPIEIGSALYDANLLQFVTKSGDAGSIYLYRNGQAVAGQSVGLEYPETPLTLWSKTDENGKVKLLLKPTSKALLRTLITEEVGTRYKSQFLSVILNPK